MGLSLFFIILSVTVFISLVFLTIIIFTMLIKKAEGKETKEISRKLKMNIILFLALLLLTIGLVLFSQISASTPEISTNENKSISELTKVKLNGRDEWISIRGENVDNPILLFLAGGPGGSQMAAVRHDLARLEKDFIVVNWDQVGSAKSYYAHEIKDITLDMYIEDGLLLTKYLINRFNKEKIYLVGESWGSALGIFLVDKAPSLYYAFASTGQMVDFKETSIHDYNKVLQLAKERGETKVEQKLISNGQPPYYGKNITFKSATYLNYLSSEMSHNPSIYNSGYNTLRDIFSSEYGLLDKINYIRGIINTFSSVFQQLYDIDLRKDITELDIPIYLFLGRHDVNAPTYLAEEYFEILKAPKKEIVWFEHSGHNPWINESDKFIDQIKIKFDEHKK